MADRDTRTIYDFKLVCRVFEPDVGVLHIVTTSYIAFTTQGSSHLLVPNACRCQLCISQLQPVQGVQNFLISTKLIKKDTMNVDEECSSTELHRDLSAHRICI